LLFDDEDLLVVPNNMIGLIMSIVPVWILITLTKTKTC